MDENEYLGFDAPVQTIFTAINTAVNAVGVAERRVSKSQIGFYRRQLFAAVWRSDQYLSGTHPPLVLSIFLKRMDRSPRWKEAVEPRAGRYSHHLTITDESEVDDQVREWLHEAWTTAV
jgi:hypothetical protein